MTPDDKLQVIKDQNKNISQAIPIIEEELPEDEAVSNPEDYDYMYEDEEDDPENPITMSPISDQDIATKTDVDKDIIPATVTGSINKDVVKDVVASTKTGDVDENDAKETHPADTLSENLNEIKKAEPLTPIGISADFNDTAMDLEELAVVPIAKVLVEPRVVTRMVINITINSEEYTPLYPDTFPNPYPDEAMKYEYVVGFGPGFGVEMIVKTIDFEAEDYLLIRPGMIYFLVTLQNIFKL